jgi:hypothetical protein
LIKSAHPGALLHPCKDFQFFFRDGLHLRYYSAYLQSFFNRKSHESL